jgi:hypothetical protein
MKKQYLLVVVFSILGMTSYGEAVSHHWYVGLEGGYTYNTVYTTSGYRAFTEYDSGNGFMLGIPVQYAFFDWLSVQSGLQYTQKNYSLKRTYIKSDEYCDWINSYIEVPLLAHFSFGGSGSGGFRGLRGFMDAGGYLGFWAQSRRKGVAAHFFPTNESPTIPDEHFDEIVSWDNERDNRFEAGLALGLGVQYRFEPFVFYVAGRYHYGLTDMQKDYMKDQVPRINDTLSVQAGVICNAGVFQLFKRGAK